jgi:hypothetical protein
LSEKQKPASSIKSSQSTPPKTATFPLQLNTTILSYHEYPPSPKLSLSKHLSPTSQSAHISRKATPPLPLFSQEQQQQRYSEIEEEDEPAPVPVRPQAVQPSPRYVDDIEAPELTSRSPAFQSNSENTGQGHSPDDDSTIDPPILDI